MSANDFQHDYNASIGPLVNTMNHAKFNFKEKPTLDVAFGWQLRVCENTIQYSSCHREPAAEINWVIATCY